MAVDVVHENSLHNESRYHHERCTKVHQGHSYDPPNKMDQGKVLRTLSQQKQ